MMTPYGYGVRYEYRIRTRLGEGGCADVFACEVYSMLGTRLTQQQLAVKVLRDAHVPEYRHRFRREAEIQRRFQHANLVPLIDVNVDAEHPFIVMPLMRETLRDLLSRMRAANEVFRAKPAIGRFILPLAGAVEHLHYFGHFHRDIKPANIFIDFDGTPMLGDFSIVHAPTMLAQYRTWCGLGTEKYTAPETLESGVASAQSDVYSLGVVLYEMLTGTTPEYCWWTNHWLRPSAQHPRSCDPLVDEVLKLMTHPLPAHRYASVFAAMEHLRTLASAVLPRLPAYQVARLRPLPQKIRLQHLLRQG